MPRNIDNSMVLVMGITGSGKSRFVNLLRAGAAREGPDLASTTKECQIVPIQVGSELVHVVDTPGFDDTTNSDAKTLQSITNFLGTQYALGIVLKGIIFLHRITDIRMQGSALKSMTMFKDVCGDHALKNVILLTTFWDLLEDQSVGARRQQQLRDDFWSDMIAKGSYVRRFNGTAGMAEALIIRLMGKEPMVLKIQRDVMQHRMRLEDTAAGERIMAIMEQSLRQKGEELNDLEMQMLEADDEQFSQLARQWWECKEEESKQRQRIHSVRQILEAEMGQEIVKKVKKQKRKFRFRDNIQLFANILGLVISATTNVVLPLLGGIGL
ncbi:P-loop containing nucleoside triphosphate hydrolase protein [Hypomontagnella monticulosa]|nr:P-loop containing nucleoside triphosphate hydrolase protein [Hypomontagnella monticulosa]